MRSNAKSKDDSRRGSSKPISQPGHAVLDIDDGTAREIVARLARVEGQVRAVSRMIEERRDCHAIVHQLGAARRALERATAQLLVTTLAQCIRTAKTAADESEIRKLTDAFIKLA
jgi:DNA-binding FrmR family transcriptional regulator